MARGVAPSESSRYLLLLDFEMNFSFLNTDLGSGVQTMSPIPPNKGPDEPSQPVANENQQIINDEAENIDPAVLFMRAAVFFSRQF